MSFPSPIGSRINSGGNPGALLLIRESSPTKMSLESRLCFFMLAFVEIFDCSRTHVILDSRLRGNDTQPDNVLISNLTN